jgi:decaprenylphospho-beta-D-ribofuranose 2-oxidase
MRHKAGARLSGYSSAAGSPISTVSTELVSFDGGSRCRQTLARPDRYRDLEALPPDQPRIVKGGGYSYAAAGFGGGGVVQDARAFNRILDFDPVTGVLECEGATTLSKIFQITVPSGWFLPVQPGYPEITVGGCIGADVHGKNQFRDGTFRAVINSLRLFHPRHGVLLLDRSHNHDIFDLTCGGLGLTGHILSARLQLARLPAARVQVFRKRIDRFEDTLPLLDRYAADADLLYTWHTFTIQGKDFGRGFLHVGRFMQGSVQPARQRRPAAFTIDARTRGRLRLQLLNRTTTGLFNRAYEAWQALHPEEEESNLFSFLFPVAWKVVYFELFGRAGFHEYQLIVPRDGFSDLVGALRAYLARHRTPVTLVSCKLFAGDRRYLRFDGAGLCLALDFPRGREGSLFASFLDDLVRDLRALPNIIKDSRLPREVVVACYPEYESFRQGLRVFDPIRLYRSEVSERLGL